MIFQIPFTVIGTTALLFVNRILFIAANIFFLLVGEKYLEKRDKINASQYFILLGAINIVWHVIELSLADFMPLLSLNLNEMYSYMLFFMYTPSFLIAILTFGVFIFLIASKNEARDGRILLFAAISSIIHSILDFIAIFLMYSSLSLGSPPNGATLIIIGISNISAMIFLVAFNILVILYSIRVDELYLKIPAILLSISTFITITSMILSLF